MWLLNHYCWENCRLLPICSDCAVVGWRGDKRERRRVEVRWVSGHAILSILWWRNRNCWRVCVCVGEKKCVKNLVCVCVWERERERERETDRLLRWEERCENYTVYGVCVYVCVCVCVCKCVCVKWCGREGEGEREGVQMLELDGQRTVTGSVAIISSPPPHLPSPTTYRHLTTTLPFLEAGGAWLRVSDFESRVELQCFRTLTQNCKKRAPAYRSSLNSPDSVGIGHRLLFFFCRRLTKKSGKWFLKKRKAKNKSGIPPKSGRLTSLIKRIWRTGHRIWKIWFYFFTYTWIIFIFCFECMNS